MIVPVKIGEVYSEITAPPAVWAIIRDACKARPDGYQWMPKYKSGQWDGYISLVRGNHVPTGLLRRIILTLSPHGHRFKYTYADSVHNDLESVADDIESIPHMLSGVTLRPYQTNAVLDLLNRGRGIAEMATNAGKTVVFAALIKLLGNANALIIVQTKDLLYQTRDRLAQYLDRPVGVIGDSHQDSDDVVVATIQTLNSMRNRLGRAEFRKYFAFVTTLVADECHHISHNKTFDVLMDIPGWYRFGMSGTPLGRGNLNDLKLIACTGPVQTRITNAQLIEAEWSAEPIVHVHHVYMDDSWEYDYPAAYSTCILHNWERNDKILRMAKSSSKRGQQVLIIVNRIEHGQHLADQLVARGVFAFFVCGSSSMEERSQALSILAAGLTKWVVVATQIFDEGVDVPALDVIILACGGKSHIKLLQRIGRGLRAKAGRNVVHIHDFEDDTNKYLFEHWERRLELYGQQGFKIKYDEGTEQIR